jgi:serine/threonine-protein kinase PRP4
MLIHCSTPEPPAIEAPEPESEPLDEAALIEQRRKRREAIKAKYRSSATPLLVQALQLGDKSGPSTPGHVVDDDTPSGRSSKLSRPRPKSLANTSSTASPFVSTPTTPTDAASPSAFAFTNDLDLANTNGNSAGAEEDGPSAADYDPVADMQEDKQRDSKRTSDEVSSGAYDETRPTTEQDVLLPVQSIEEKPKRSKDDFDMFADDDDDDDMFAEDAVSGGEAGKEDAAKAVPIPQAKVLDVGMLDNWDDSEGYYKIILGEKLDNRYHVLANLGQGMFSGVVRATDMTSNKLVAIKLIRNNETM